MIFSYLDWGIIGIFLMLSLGIGVWSSKKAGKDLESFFLAGKDMPGGFLALAWSQPPFQQIHLI